MIKGSCKYQWLMTHVNINDSYTCASYYFDGCVLFDYKKYNSSSISCKVLDFQWLPCQYCNMLIKDSCKYQWLKTHVNIND
jgi:hypothetical protein